MTAPVLIVGGGLAGAATALGLSRHGVPVTLIERATFPRDKPCGEGLMPNGLAALAALGLSDLLHRAEGVPFVGIAYRAGPYEALADFAAPETGLGVQRRRLDAALNAAAGSAPGVERISGAVRAVTCDARGASVTLAGGRMLRGVAIVGADGPRSVVRHALGLDAGAPANGRYGLRRHFRLAEGVPRPARVQVSFHAGYELYVTPVAERVVGVAALCERATLQEGGGDKARRLEQLLARAPAAVQSTLVGAQPLDEALACGPLRVRARQVFRDRALLVGDAAGYVDAITGEGMSLALASATFATAALVAWLARGWPRSLAFHQYAARRRALALDHIWLTHAVVAIARRPSLSAQLVRGLARQPALFAELLALNHGARGLSAALGRAPLLRLAGS